MPDQVWLPSGESGRMPAVPLDTCDLLTGDQLTIKGIAHTVWTADLLKPKRDNAEDDNGLAPAFHARNRLVKSPSPSEGAPYLPVMERRLPRLTAL